MTKLVYSILLGAGLLFAGCTVHHYHHDGPGPGHARAKAQGGGHGCSCDRLPEGHPPLDAHHGMKGHGMKGHGMKGHGMKGHGMKGHGMKGHGMKGHGMKGHGMKGHGMKGHPGGHEHEGEGHAGKHDDKAMEKLPSTLKTYHDAFAAAWHLEADEQRRAASCKAVGKWKKMALAVKKTEAKGEHAKRFAGAANTLHLRTQAVGSACLRNKANVQEALKAAHEALHEVFKVAAEASF